MKKLTKTQKEILTYVREYYGKNKSEPTITKLALEFNKSKEAIFFHMLNLKKSGYLFGNTRGKYSAFRTISTPSSSTNTPLRANIRPSEVKSTSKHPRFNLAEVMFLIAGLIIGNVISLIFLRLIGG